MTDTASLTLPSSERHGHAADRRSCRLKNIFDDNAMAKGYNWLGTGRGPIIMTNIFLNSAFIYLASEEVGCMEEVYNVNSNTTKWQVVEDCDVKVYGVFVPAALVTNIATISGVLSAFFMPVIGAIVDYTSHRWAVGVVMAVLIIMIQGAQTFTNSQTWFAMSILQALTGFFYQIQILASYAYLPEISRAVGGFKMTQFTAIFTMVQFGSQLLFLVLVIGLSMGFGWDDVRTAQVSQAINAVQISFSFYLGWRLLPKTPASHSLPDGKHLLFQGFAQNWATAKNIQRDYKKGLRWFLLALCFAEATANTFTLVAVVFLDGVMGFSGTQIGIFFAISLVCTIPGGLFARFVTSKTNPNTSWRLSMIVLFGLGVFGGLVLNRDTGSPLAYVWGAMVGITLGWFYPTERLFFSMIVPHGLEAELSGFYVYCSQIIAWLPPLVFSILVEANVAQGYGVIAISGFAIIAVALLSMAAPWPEILADTEEEKSTESAEA